MKSNAPWSVKGIERDARETAKDAAKREGMTVGEWLNQMIYSAGEAEPSDGEIEGLKLRDIVTAIEHLQNRIVDTSEKGAEAVGDLSRNIGGVVERIQRLERVKPVEGGNADMSARLEKLEGMGGDRQRIDALKALEKAVAQVAVQFNNAHKTSIDRLDANEQQLQELAARIDSAGGDNEDTSGVGFLKDAIDGLSTRISRAERIAGEASKIRDDAGESMDPDFVERTGARLRVLGEEIKRGGDQIGSLEATISKLAEQIDAAERRSAEGVQKVAETISDLREQFSGENDRDVSRTEIDDAIAAASRETENRIGELQSSFDDMIGRLEALGATGATDRAHEEERDDGGEPVAPLAFDIVEENTAEESESETAVVDEDEAVDNTIDEPSAEAEQDPAALAHTDNDAAAETEEDPFAFAEGLDLQSDEPDAAERDDDFSFELDEDEPGVAAGTEADDSAKDLLSEVQQVFGKKTPPADEADQEALTADTGAETAGEDDDLDAILADLDNLTGDSDAPPPVVAEAAEGAQSATETASTEDSKSGEKEDYLKAARRRAKEAVARAAAEDEKPTRRNLTAKQKAILAARAKKKRQAAAESADQPAAEQPETADQTETSVQADESEAGRFAKITAAIASARSKLPFIGGKTEDEPDTEAIAPVADSVADVADNEGISKNGDRAAFRTLKATAAARPVTLALGVAIFLAIAALFFLIKDLVFKPPQNLSNQPAAITATPTDAAGAEQQGGTPALRTEQAIEVPSAPSIDPYTLYNESIAALNAANTDEETAAAISKLEEAAAIGHPPAQLQLGELYKTGQGVEQDLGQARSWFRRSANGGNVLAMHRIGVMTARGDGGPADTAEAVGWFELAGNHGLVDSQYNLGAIFHPGDDSASSTIQDAGKAYFWYSLAAKNGDEQAAPLAAGVSAALTTAQRRTQDAAIAEWEAAPSDARANELAAAE